MTPIYLPSHRASRRRPIVLLILGLALLSVFLFQQAQAQGPALKPPFKLIRAEHPRSLESHGPVALPLNAPIILSQTFDSTYTPVPQDQLGWHETVGISATIGYTWKRVTTGPHPDTVWSVGRNPSGYPLLNPATGTYTNGMEALLVYGPLNLSDYYQLVLTSTYWLDAQPGDYAGLAYSTDGTNFIELGAQSFSDPTLSNAHTAYAGLNVLAGKPVVWIAFTFVSNDDNLVARGAFIKDMVLRGSTFYKIFLPLIRRDPTPTPTNTPTPTPTPTPTATPSASYRYFYTFSDQTPTNNPDFNRWGGDRSTSCGTDCRYYQELGRGLGNPGNALKLWLQGVKGTGGAGPRQNGVSLSTATNFEYSADFYVYNGQLDARYALVFDASSGTFQGDGEPPMSTDSNYYLLELRLDITTRTKVAKWQFVRVVNGGRQAVTPAADLPFSINQGQWHNVKVRQSGTSLSFYLNGQLVATTTDNYGWGNERRRFGLYIDVRDSNGVNGPFEFFADNIAVMDLP